MIRIIRRDPYGGKGFKDFEDEKSANEWLKSESVKQDTADGFTFEKESV